jgi:hypothetical protein
MTPREKLEIQRDAMAVNFKALGTLLEIAASSADIEQCEISIREALRRLEALKRTWIRVEGIDG